MKMKITLMLLSIFTISSRGTAQITATLSISPGTIVCDTTDVTFTLNISSNCTLANSVSWVVNGLTRYTCPGCTTWTTNLFDNDTIAWCNINCSPVGTGPSNSLVLDVSPCVGIEEYTNGTQLTMYPNPSTGIITIDTEKLKMFPASLIVFDNRGRVVDAVYEIKNRSAVLNAKQFPNGIYYYSITDKTGDKTATGKFMISK